MLNVNPIELKSAEIDDGNAIVTKALDDFSKTIGERIAAVETKAADRLDKLEIRINRGAIAGNGERKEVAPEVKAFDSFMRRGVERMGAEEVKNLVAGTGSAGGFLAPPAYGDELIKLLRQFSPIRQYSKVITISSGEVIFPRRTGSTAATWVSETATRTASGMTFDQVTLTPYEMATYSDVSNQLLEDNVYDLQGELTADLAESFAKAEGTAFVNGTGTSGGQPDGLMTSTAITNSLNSGYASSISTTSADVLIELFHALPAVIAQNAVWIMNRNTLAVIRTIKTSIGDYPLLNQLTQGAPLTLLGRPIVEAIDMPDIAANAYPILFGDLSGYRIVDRVAFGLQRDPYSVALNGQTRFHARRRVGAGVTHPDRFVKLKISA